MFVISSITSALLFVQFSLVHSRALLAISGGYLLSALTVANGTVAQNTASKTSMVARANRFWTRLGGSVDSRTCCSSKTPLVGTSASAREPRWVPF